MPDVDAKKMYYAGFAALALISAPANAQNPLEVVVVRVGDRLVDGTAIVEIRILNAGDQTQNVDLPQRISAQLVMRDDNRRVWLDRAAQTPASISIAARGFASARYCVDLPQIADTAILSVPAWSNQYVAIVTNTRNPSHRANIKGIAEDMATATSVAPTPIPPTPPPTDRRIGNAFLSNLSAYEPIYAVYGPGTNTDARIQLSFKYQLFGSHARQEGASSLADGLYFAYTQRMFWDLEAESSPFRNIDYQPELFYLSPAMTASQKATVSGQVGIRHESNGKAGPDSRSVNGIYVSPMGAFSLGGDARLIVAPRLWLYVGDRSDNPDIRRYRGNTGLVVQIGRDNGLRLTTSSRFNFWSGKGSLGADLSYPMNRLLGGGPDFYLFAQSFVGYGENLLDYNKSTTRLRIGVALVR